MAACPKLKPGQLSRLEEKQQRRMDEARQLRECYYAVNQRDGYRCRVCRAWCDLSALWVLARPHHHHIQYRSQGGQDDAANVCLLCPTCHDAIHVKGTLKLEGDANQRDPLTQKLNGIAVYRAKEHGFTIERWC